MSGIRNGTGLGCEREIAGDGSEDNLTTVPSVKLDLSLGIGLRLETGRVWDGLQNRPQDTFLRRDCAKRDRGRNRHFN